MVGLRPAAACAASVRRCGQSAEPWRCTPCVPVSPTATAGVLRLLSAAQPAQRDRGQHHCARGEGGAPGRGGGRHPVHQQVAAAPGQPAAGAWAGWPAERERGWHRRRSAPVCPPGPLQRRRRRPALPLLLPPAMHTRAHAHLPCLTLATLSSAPAGQARRHLQCAVPADRGSGVHGAPHAGALPARVATLRLETARCSRRQRAQAGPLLMMMMRVCCTPPALCACRPPASRC